MELQAEKCCQQQELTVGSSLYPLDLKTSLFFLWIIVYLFGRLHSTLGDVSTENIIFY